MKDLAQEYWRDTPEDLRERFRVAARKTIAAHAADEGVPVEEIVTNELVENVAAGLLERHMGDLDALVKEHVSGEEMKRRIFQEFAALSQEYPDGVPESALTAAVKTRLERERPATRRGR